MTSTAHRIPVLVSAFSVVVAMTGCDPYGNTFGCGRAEIEVESSSAMTSAGISFDDAQALATGAFELEWVWERDPVWSASGDKTSFEFDEVRGLLTTGGSLSSEMNVDESDSSPHLYETYVDDEDGKANPSSAANCRNTPDYVEVPTSGTLVVNDAVVYEGGLTARLWNEDDGTLVFGQGATDLSQIEIPWVASAPATKDAVALGPIYWRYSVDGWEADVFATLRCADDDCSGLGYSTLQTKIARIVPRGL